MQESQFSCFQSEKGDWFTLRRPSWEHKLKEASRTTFEKRRHHQRFFHLWKYELSFVLRECCPIHEREKEESVGIDPLSKGKRVRGKSHVERRKIEIGRSIVDVGIFTIRVEARVGDTSSESKEKWTIGRLHEWISGRVRSKEEEGNRNLRDSRRMRNKLVSFHESIPNSCTIGKSLRHSMLRNDWTSVGCQRTKREREESVWFEPVKDDDDGERLTFSSSTETRIEEVVTTSISRAVLCFPNERDGRVLKIVPKEFDECVFENVTDFRIRRKRVE